VCGCNTTTTSRVGLRNVMAIIYVLHIHDYICLGSANLYVKIKVQLTYYICYRTYMSCFVLHPLRCQLLLDLRLCTRLRGNTGSRLNSVVVYLAVCSCLGAARTIRKLPKRPKIAPTPLGQLMYRFAPN
jgi:hypothetical protein